MHKQLLTVRRFSPFQEVERRERVERVRERGEVREREIFKSWEHILIITL